MYFHHHQALLVSYLRKELHVRTPLESNICEHPLQNSCPHSGQLKCIQPPFAKENLILQLGQSNKIQQIYQDPGKNLKKNNWKNCDYTDNEMKSSNCMLMTSLTNSIGGQVSCKAHGLVLRVIVNLPLFILLAGQALMLIFPLNNEVLINTHCYQPFLSTVYLSFSWTSFELQHSSFFQKL